MKRLKYWIGALLLFVVALILNFYFRSSITFLDYPFKLSNKIQTIEVVYVNWACDCADFVATKYFANHPGGEIHKEDCIFIEPAQSTRPLSSKFYEKDHFEKKLRLHGQFYLGKGISRSYEQKTPEKPVPARVFRYLRFELLDKKQ